MLLIKKKKGSIKQSSGIDAQVSLVLSVVVTLHISECISSNSLTFSSFSCMIYLKGLSTISGEVRHLLREANDQITKLLRTFPGPFLEYQLNLIL